MADRDDLIILQVADDGSLGVPMMTLEYHGYSGIRLPWYRRLWAWLSWVFVR